MANENNGIGSIVKKCKILLLDIEGTTTSISFVKDKLFPYAEENVKQFLENKWDDENVKEVVVALRKLALEDQEKSVEGVVSIPGEDASKEEQIEGVVNNVKWQMSSDRKAGPLKLLQGLIWKQGYDKGEIKGHVYDDVSPALEQWRSVDGQKVYIYSSGSVEAQKLLFGQSLAGDLLPQIDGHFDTAVGAKQEAGSYAAIAEKIGCKPDEILFLTDIVKEAEAARASGLHAALISREGNAPLPADAANTFPVLHTFAQLSATNKRKPDPQDEQPAKVAKTDIEEDVKKAPEADFTKEPEAPCAEQDRKPEKMEVEETTIKEEQNATTQTEPKVKVEPKAIVEEITELNENTEITDIPVCDVEPVIIEDKTDEKETEKMDTQTPETVSSTDSKVQVDGKNEDIPITDDKIAAVITEIEDITEKQPLPEVAEIIDDLEPVVEEPSAVEDMEVLQNVGEVLEKECDEILSKVQDVTNLDNIPLKPLLTTIAEETMETDNVDSNDIVDRILDTELELEMKQCEDIDLNTVSEMTETKTDEKSEHDETDTAKNVTPDLKEKGDNAETNNLQEKNESSPKEQTVSETKAEKSKPEAEVEKTSEVAKTSDVAKATDNEVENKENVAAKCLTTKTETKENNIVPEPVNTDSDVKEPQINGKETNGDSETVNLNGDASNTEELNARLSVENGKEEVNGSNCDSVGEQGQGDSAVEAEVSDIKVKTVAVEEPRTDPIEQPTEA